MLESLLRAFGKASSRNAFPSGTKIAVSVVGGKWWEYFTAPDDGYFVIAVSGANSIVELKSRLASGNQRETGTASSFVSVSKGETIMFYAKGDNPAAEFIHSKASL